ncbi:hypothetical protein FACS1894109_14410 [Spirochaetia bacterium]|nr:hypothetical protein FACS1894109_14410 [Spirochaetia bacterium]
MKRIALSFLMVSALCGLAFAEPDAAANIGLSAGIEFGLDAVQDKPIPTIMPLIAWENSFGNLDVSVELDYEFALGDELAQGGEFDAVLAYNLHLGESRTLSIGLENDTEFVVGPGEGNNAVFGWVDPNVGITQALGFGDLSAAIGFPIDYLQELKADGAAIRSYLTLALAFPFGLGFELTGNIGLSDAEYLDTNFVITFERESFAIGLEIDADTKEFDRFSLKPGFEYYLKQFTFWAGVDLEALGSDEMNIKPYIGAKYSF